MRNSAGFLCLGLSPERTLRKLWSVQIEGIKMRVKRDRAFDKDVKRIGESLWPRNKRKLTGNS